MSFYMRAVMRAWEDRRFEDLVSWVEAVSDGMRVISPGDRGWLEFEVLDAGDTSVLQGDLSLAGGEGSDMLAEEREELLDFLDEFEGSGEAVARVREHLQSATAIVGMRVSMTSYEASVAAANLVIAFLEQRPGVLTQVDALGWYDGDELILDEEDQ